MRLFDNNRERMDFPGFRAQGLRAGSSVVEAGCETAVGARLKRAGGHWSVDGANAMLALRCCVLSSRYEDFWAERAAHPAQNPAPISRRCRTPLCVPTLQPPSDSRARRVAI